jgi:heme-degrading monooxygenase HmoA
MESEALHAGERIRVNVPGLGDHGQLGTITQVHGDRYFVHLDWDDRPQHRAWFYAADLERVPDEPVPTLASHVPRLPNAG